MLIMVFNEIPHATQAMLIKKKKAGAE
jgi:hypothetical protein